MTRIQELNSRREQVVLELAGIQTLRKGNLNEQWFPVVRNGKRTKELRGPYFVWSYKVGKKTVSVRLKDEQAIARARQDATNYRRFKELCGELEIIIAEQGEAEAATSNEQLKKTRKSPSNKARKSRK